MFDEILRGLGEIDFWEEEERTDENRDVGGGTVALGRCNLADNPCCWGEND
jgi:hypothetical protein